MNDLIKRLCHIFQPVAVHKGIIHNIRIFISAVFLFRIMKKKTTLPAGFLSPLSLKEIPAHSWKY